jgi:surface protein
MLSREKNYFINFKLKRKNYDIYFNDSNEIIKKDYFTRKYKVYKIRINIKHERKDEDLSELFYISENNIDSRYNCIKEINFIRFFDKSIEDMSYMFYKCSSLTKIKFSEFHSNNVKNMSHMFFGCSSLLSVELTKFNTKNVWNMSYMFYKCSSIKEIPDISKWDIISVYNMNYMFSECSALSKFPNISKWNPENIQNFDGMFKNCKSILNLPYLSSFIKNIDSHNNDTSDEEIISIQNNLLLFN